jgi:hypothetical protein
MADKLMASVLFCLPGLDDLIVSARKADPSSQSNAGKSLFAEYDIRFTCV